MWSLTLCFLPMTAALAVGGLFTLTIPYLLHGSDFRSFIGIEVTGQVAFLALFYFRYWRLVIHSIAYSLYKPAPCALIPKYTSAVVTLSRSSCPRWSPPGPCFAGATRPSA